jgi:hypothetical protein
MWKRVRTALGRIGRGGRATPKHRAHDPREARRYRDGGDIDIANADFHATGSAQGLAEPWSPAVRWSRLHGRVLVGDRDGARLLAWT